MHLCTVYHYGLFDWCFHLAEKESENVSHRTNYNKVERAEPQSRSFSFQKVTYGGVDGTYYTATTSRRKGKDGVRYFNILSLQ